MPNKVGNGFWSTVEAIVQRVEEATTDPVERWGMLKGVLYARANAPTVARAAKYNAIAREKRKKNASKVQSVSDARTGGSDKEALDQTGV